MSETRIEDRELTEFRQQYYGLLVNLLSREPTGALLEAISQGIGERAEAARGLHPLLGEAWDHLEKVLPGLSVETAEEEFLKLFIGPFQPEMNAYESWYLTGQLFQAPLAHVRGFLRQVGLERQEQHYPEPEDALAFELEVMNWLITRQLAAGSEEEQREWMHRQSAFLTQHLLIWVPRCSEDMEATKSASLYKGVAKLISGLVAIERQRLMGHGISQFESLDQARKRYGSPRTFQGPVFDPAQGPPGGNPGAGTKDK